MSGLRWASEQVAAITSAGHRLLEANAGSGKTTTVVGKILWHLGVPLGEDERGMPVPACPDHLRLRLDQVAAITFTEKAAHDLASTLRKEIRRHAPHLLWDIDRASIGTIHSFCGNVLREHSLRFGVDPAFRVLDERESRLELKAVLKDVILEAAQQEEPAARLLLARYDLDSSFEHTTGVVDFVGAMVRDLRWHRERYEGWNGRSNDQSIRRAAGDQLDWSRLDALAGGGDAKDATTAKLCDALVTLGRRAVGRWEAYLAAENLKDFDALILDCRDRLLNPGSEAALASIRSGCRLLIIDEFQDTDSAQRDIVFRIAGLDGSAGNGAAPQLFLVGDPKQSIYGFRGADIAVWNEVAAAVDAPLSLSRNYRSVPAVIEYVNRAAGSVIAEAGRAASAERVAGEPSTAVQWAPLVGGRDAGPAAPLEWLVTTEKKAEDRRAEEADLVARRIRDLVVDRVRGDSDGVEIVDPDSGKPRLAEYRDVAILFRSGTGVESYAQALARWGVPCYLAGNLGLSKQLELEDLLNLFRLVANPLDDLAAFAWLRSPFVGLRDEVLTRIRMEAGRRPLVYAAESYLKSGEWFEAPEHPAVVALERIALERGLGLLEDLETLKSRVPLDQLALLALERSGYPLHIQLLEQPLPRLANLQRFVRMLEAYRGHTVGSFLELWDEWKSEDVGLPQAPLYSKRDNVVTLSTVHAAKGLEWPIVVLVDLTDLRDKTANTLWSDRTLGPILATKLEDRGVRAAKLCRRRQAEERAEEARVFYVAATRARDRLIVAGPAEPAKPRGEWAWRGRSDAMLVTAEIPDVAPLALTPEPELSWLDGIVACGERSRLAGSVRAPALQYTRSATELMARSRGREDHRLRYVHGVLPPWRFGVGQGREGAKPGGRLRADLKGTLVHGVLERIQDESEVEELLDVVIGSVDAEDVGEELGRDTELRKAIEGEIRRVVTSPEWRWYVEGEHWRELGFVQFRSRRRWRVGAMDLLKADGRTVGRADGQTDGQTDGRSDRAGALIVDFKTQDVSAAAASAEAEKYRLQALTYRRVYRVLTSETAEVEFHFTGPGTAVRC